MMSGHGLSGYLGTEKERRFVKCFGRLCVLSVALMLGWIATASVAAAAEAAVGPDRQATSAMIDRGVSYLKTHGQEEDGSFSPRAGSGVTALVAASLLRSGLSPDDPVVAKSLKYLEKCVQPDGGIHLPQTRLANYETCVAILCFTEANRDGRYDEILKRAEARVRGYQWDEAGGKGKSDFSYGGVGYGGKSRPDLSNTAFLVDALKASGAKDSDEAIQKALVFVSRCQNLESEYNTTPFAAKINDGGFYYTPVVSGQGQGRETPDGGLRSYGAMSYSGLKSMIYAGLTNKDPRVKAVMAWIRKHYSVTTNPGVGDAGLYYYYHTFSKALDVLGEDFVESDDGVKHDWRKELAEELGRRQKADGSWVNSTTHWFEGDPNLVTAYSLLSLSYCKAPNAAPAAQ